MDMYVKALAGVLLSLVLILLLGNRSKEMSSVVAMLVCCMTALMAMEYIRPVISFIRQLEEIGGLDQSLVKLVLKAAGIGILSEIASLVCTDSGSSSLGKAVKLLGSAAILWLSLPLFTMMIQLLQEILGDI